MNIVVVIYIPRKIDQLVEAWLVIIKEAFKHNGFLFPDNFKTSMLHPEPPETFKYIFLCPVITDPRLLSSCHALQPGSEKPVPIFQNSSPWSSESRSQGQHEEGLGRERGARLRDHQQVDPHQSMGKLIMN